MQHIHRSRFILNEQCYSEETDIYRFLVINSLMAHAQIVRDIKGLRNLSHHHVNYELPITEVIVLHEELQQCLSYSQYSLRNMVPMVGLLFKFLTQPKQFRQVPWPSYLKFASGTRGSGKPFV